MLNAFDNDSSSECLIFLNLLDGEAPIIFLNESDFVIKGYFSSKSKSSFNLSQFESDIFGLSSKNNIYCVVLIYLIFFIIIQYFAFFVHQVLSDHFNNFFKKILFFCNLFFSLI